MHKMIFIGGAPRSGTNLTRRIIGSHSKIAVTPGEFQYLKQYVRGRTVEQILTGNKQLKRWGIDLSDLYDLPPREAFITALERYAESVNKEIPGDKTPFNEFYFDLLEYWLTDRDLRFICLVRNPFDVVASHKNAPFRKGDDPNNYEVIDIFARNWTRSVSVALARSFHSPENYKVVRYEDLTAEPISHTAEMCEFLGVDFEEQRMLAFADYKGHKDNTSFNPAQDQLHNRYSHIRQPESRKDHLTSSEIRIVSSLCGEIACALGYADKDFKPAPIEIAEDFTKKLKRVVKSYISLA